MATFTDIRRNLGVKLIITETSQNISNNTTTISYSARAYKTGNHHDPWNHYTQTPFKLIINGEVIFNKKANYDLQGSRMEQVITSGTRTIKHNDDGSKSISASWSSDFSSTGTQFGYGPVLASGTMNLTNIPRVSKPSLSKVNFNFGELVTLTTNRKSTNFTHSASYVVGGVETLLAKDIGVSQNIAIPVSRANSIPNSSSESMNIRVKTFNGTIEIGSHDIPVTVNVPSTVIPKVDGVSLSETVSSANIFSSNNSNYIRGISKVKATAINARGEYGSTINQYEFRLKDNTSYNGTSKSDNFTFGVLNIPAKGSQLYKFQCRVRDSRGRYSNWVDSSDVRFHYYAPPTINTPILSRNDTVLSVERTYSVQSIMENGVERNVGNLSFQTRPKGSSSWTSNGGAKHAGTSLNKDSDNLLGVFLENVAYEVQGILSDRLSTVYSGIAVAGAAFVTLEVLLGTGIGVGRSPIAGNANLQVGAGGVNSDGAIKMNGFDISQGRHDNYKNFTVGGDANTYYPVAIKGQAQFGFHRYSITRGYNWDAPNTWNNTTHRGGLTLDFEWSGDSAWGGNDQYIRVIEFSQKYSAMVGGMALGRGDDTSLIVWLRGGGALYRLYSEMGSMATVNVHLGNLTDASGEVFPTRTSPVNSEIFNRYPVRSDGELYSLGNKVLSENNMNELLSDYAKTTNIPHTNYGLFNDRLGAYIEVSNGRIMSGIATATGDNTSTFNSLNNAVTFPKPFSTNTNYPVMVTYSISSNVTNVNSRMIAVNIRNVSRTGFTWDARDAAGGTAPSGGTVYTLHWMAMGVI